jgi:hypothetical protein
MLVGDILELEERERGEAEGLVEVGGVSPLVDISASALAFIIDCSISPTSWA